MADKEFNVRISAEVDEFTKGVNQAEKGAKKLGESLERDIVDGARTATESLNEVTEALKKLQQEARGCISIINNFGDNLDKASSSADSTSDSVNILSNETSDLRNDIDGASNSTN